MTEEEITPVVEQKERIELTKNSKGYTWTIKIFLKDNDTESLARLENLNEEMKKRFGNDNLS